MNIGEASKASGVSTKMIRYYESIGLIPAAMRTGSGYRVYSGTEIQLLRFIRRSRDLGFPVEKIEELLALWRDRTRQSADVKRLALEQIDGLKRKVQEMQGMIDTLRHLADACCGDHHPDCPILEDLGHGAVAGIGQHDRGTEAKSRHHSRLHSRRFGNFE
ncbi:MAG TPA: Cu(I)-responsive transcriptional regulator [Albidovulum sp.]|uniref:Cu(I)-responsive transcriptional regulator n=1 Tax=Albidovulum sp. TaxID=1872424 RepID=UPI002CAAF4DA|nr:Cu(I)-responsive transcriptional regulator [Albidovulum sp.]